MDIDGETDLMKRQLHTWAKIPSGLQEVIVAGVRERIRDHMRQNNRFEDNESTAGFDDDLEALEAELTREALGKPTRRVGLQTQTGRCGTRVNFEGSTQESFHNAMETAADEEEGEKMETVDVERPGDVEGAGHAMEEEL